MPALSPETRRTASQDVRPHLPVPPVPSRAPLWNGTSSAEYGVASMNILTVKVKKYRGWFIRWCYRDVGAGSLQVFGARCGGLILIEAVYEGAGLKAILDEKHVPTLEAADLADADLAPPTSAMTFAQTLVRRSGVGGVKAVACVGNSLPARCVEAGTSRQNCGRCECRSGIWPAFDLQRCRPSHHRRRRLDRTPK